MAELKIKLNKFILSLLQVTPFKNFYPFDLVSTIYGNMFINKKDVIISKCLKDRGYFEEEEVEIVKNFIEKKYKQKLSVFFDIGANIGTHSIYALKKNIFEFCFAFEPELLNYKLLLKNIAINGLKNKIVAYDIALSNTFGKKNMLCDEENFGDHRILSNTALSNKNKYFRFGELEHRKKVSIKTETIDNFFKSAKWNSMSLNLSDILMWIDTQGHEGFIFEGGRNLFSNQNSVNFIVCEFFPYGIEQAVSKLYYFRFLKNYEIYIIKLEDKMFVNVTINEIERLYYKLLNNSKNSYHLHLNLLLVKKNLKKRIDKTS